MKVVRYGPTPEPARVPVVTMLIGMMLGALMIFAALVLAATFGPS